MKVQSEAKEIGMSKDSTDGGLTMIVEKLPAVLQHPQGSLSVERVLKNALECLHHALMPPQQKWEDRQQIAIDDLESMIGKGFE